MDCCVQEEWPLGKQDLKTPSKVTHILKLWLFSSGPDVFSKQLVVGVPRLCAFTPWAKGRITSKSSVWPGNLTEYEVGLGPKPQCLVNEELFPGQYILPMQDLGPVCDSNRAMRFPYQSRVLLTVIGQNKTGCISLGMFVEAVDNGSMLLAMGQYLTT